MRPIWTRSNPCATSNLAGSRQPIAKTIYGDRHIGTATLLSNLGKAWLSLSDAQKAKAHFERAHAILTDVYGPEHPSTKVVKRWLDRLAGSGGQRG